MPSSRSRSSIRPIPAMLAGHCERLKEALERALVAFEAEFPARDRFGDWPSPEHERSERRRIGFDRGRRLFGVAARDIKLAVVQADAELVVVQPEYECRAQIDGGRGFEACLERDHQRVKAQLGVRGHGRATAPASERE